MDATVIGNVLLDLFELEAFVGLSLLAIVIVVLVHALLAGRHDHGIRSHGGIYP